MLPHGLPFTSSPAPARTKSPRYLASILLSLGALGLSVGCTTTRATHVVSAPPPRAPTSSVTTTTTTSTPVGVAVSASGTQVVNSTTVTQAPPALQDEVSQPRPTSRHMWLAGYWTWRNERYEWMSGHWALPPNSNSTWVAPRWERRGNAYLFHEGYWN